MSYEFPKIQPYGIPRLPVILSGSVGAASTQVLTSMPIPLSFYVTQIYQGPATGTVAYEFWIGPPNETDPARIRANGKSLFSYSPTQQLFTVGSAINIISDFYAGPFKIDSCLYIILTNAGGAPVEFLSVITIQPDVYKEKV